MHLLNFNNKEHFALIVVNPTSNLQHGEVFLVGCPQLPSYLQTVTSNRNQSTRCAVVTTDQLEMPLGVSQQ